MENFVVGLLVVLIASMPLWARWIARRLSGPTPIKLTGTFGPVDQWLSRVADKAARRVTDVNWAADVYEHTDDDGRITFYSATIASRTTEVRVKVPAFESTTIFTRESPLIATVELTRFLYLAAPMYRIFLGKYPDRNAIMARSRVIRQLKKRSKHARALEA